MSAGTDKVVDAFLGGVGAGAGYALASDLYAGLAGKRGKRNPAPDPTPREWLEHAERRTTHQVTGHAPHGKRDLTWAEVAQILRAEANDVWGYHWQHVGGDPEDRDDFARDAELLAGFAEYAEQRAGLFPDRGGGRLPNPLTDAQRDRLPKSAFGLPGERKYPMPDASHAANAKARATQEYRAGRLTRAQRDRIMRKANRLLYGVSSTCSTVPKGAKDNPAARSSIAAFVMPTGISWVDTSQDGPRTGDWTKVGHLFFSDLRVEIPKGTPRAVEEDVRRRAAVIQAKRGEQYQISGSGQTITLGHALNPQLIVIDNPAANPAPGGYYVATVRLGFTPRLGTIYRSFVSAESYANALELAGADGDVQDNSPTYRDRICASTGAAAKKEAERLARQFELPSFRGGGGWTFADAYADARGLPIPPPPPPQAMGRRGSANPVPNPSRSADHDRLRRKIEKRFKRKLTAAEQRDLDHAIKAAREFHDTGSLEVDFGRAAPGSPSIVGGAGNLTHLDYEVPWPKSKRRGKWTHKAGDHGRSKKKTRPALLGYGPPDKQGVRWPVIVAPPGASPTFKPSHGFMG